MKFIVKWKIPSETRIAAEKRFLESGGAPPAGVHLIGRWHGASGWGLAVAETTDAKALYTWVQQWNDVLELDVTPCLDDAEGAEVISSVKR
jgi:Domain of unknown function (DUF3303)